MTIKPLPSFTNIKSIKTNVALKKQGRLNTVNAVYSKDVV